MFSILWNLEANFINLKQLGSNLWDTYKTFFTVPNLHVCITSQFQRTENVDSGLEFLDYFSMGVEDSRPLPSKECPKTMEIPAQNDDF